MRVSAGDQAWIIRQEGIDGKPDCDCIVDGGMAAWTYTYCARLRFTLIIVALGTSGSIKTTSLTYATGGKENSWVCQHKSSRLQTSLRPI